MIINLNMKKEKTTDDSVKDSSEEIKAAGIRRRPANAAAQRRDSSASINSQMDH
jgi:hypothetical protein